MIHTVKGFHVVNEAEVDVFLEFLCFLYDPVDVGNLISGSSDFSKHSLYIWKFLIQVPLKTNLKDFEHNPTSIGREHNCIPYHFPSLGLGSRLTFSSPVATAEFSKFANLLSTSILQHHLLAFEIAQLEFHHLQ